MLRSPIISAPFVRNCVLHVYSMCVNGRRIQTLQLGTKDKAAVVEFIIWVSWLQQKVVKTISSTVQFLASASTQQNLQKSDSDFLSNNQIFSVAYVATDDSTSRFSCKFKPQKCFTLGSCNIVYGKNEWCLTSKARVIYKSHSSFATL